MLAAASERFQDERAWLMLVSFDSGSSTTGMCTPSSEGLRDGGFMFSCDAFELVEEELATLASLTRLRRLSP